MKKDGSRDGGWFGKSVAALVAAVAMAACGGGAATRTNTAANAPGPLDGRTFPVSFELDGGWRADVMKFESGRVELVECVRHGFDRPSYSSEPEGGAVAFAAHLTHGPSHEILDLRGTVRGETVEGSYEWHKRDGAVVTGRIRGAQ